MKKTEGPLRRLWVLNEDLEWRGRSVADLKAFQRWEETRLWDGDSPATPSFYWAVTGFGPFVFMHPWTTDQVAEVASGRPGSQVTQLEVDKTAYQDLTQHISRRSSRRLHPPPERFNPYKCDDPFLLSEFFHASFGRPHAYLEETVRNRHTPSQLIKRFFERFDGALRRAAAGNPTIGRELLQKLVEDSSKHVRIAAAQNRCATPEMLLRLSEDADEDVRAVVVSNRNTPVEALRRLEENGEINGLFLTLNGAIPDDIAIHALERLVESGTDYDRERIAIHPLLTSELVRRLAGSDVERVRSQLARRLDLEPEIRERLENDSSPHVRAVADEAREWIKAHRQILDE